MEYSKLKKYGLQFRVVELFGLNIGVNRALATTCVTRFQPVPVSWEGNDKSCSTNGSPSLLKLASVD